MSIWLRINRRTMSRLTGGLACDNDTYVSFKRDCPTNARIYKPPQAPGEPEESCGFSVGNAREMRCLAAQLEFLADRMQREGDDETLAEDP
jgi:hypothetical protein